MALGALIAAYQEDDSGRLRALLPLAGRTLLEYQARCAAAAGASPIVLLVERMPPALNHALERLRDEGLGLFAVSDGNEAASRFEPGNRILLIGDGIAPPIELLTRLAEEEEPAVVTVRDDEQHQQFERIDAASRWAGIALVEGRTLGSTAAMLGDWDLQSTLLRRSLQAGALQMPIPPDAPEPLLAERVEQLAGFERKLVTGSRTARTDFASRFVLPIIEDFATERLMETRVRPGWLVSLALVLTLAAAFGFTRGWLWPALAMLLVSTPLDLVARRLATLRLKPLLPRMLARRLLWPAAGVALLALGWSEMRDGAGWGAFLAAAAAAAFAEATRVERGQTEVPGRIWLFTRRNAILAALPFALGGAWTALLVFLLAYASVSFFYLQHINHRIRVD
jgi:hypothetical protein